MRGRVGWGTWLRGIQFERESRMGAPGPGDYERESILGCLALGTLCAGEIRLRRRFFLLRPKRRFSGLAPGERSEPGASELYIESLHMYSL